MECFFSDEPCGTFGFEASVNSLHLVDIKPGKNYQNSFYYQDIRVVLPSTNISQELSSSLLNLTKLDCVPKY